jgi:predicted alpha/beta superfamily hydrolase
MSSLQTGIDLREFHSQLLDQDLVLYVKLPWSYERSDQTYPLLLTLDANRSFPLYSTASLVFETPGFSQEEILIAGVGYKVDPDRILALAQWTAWRTRDLTPTRREEAEKYWQRVLGEITGGEAFTVQTGGAGLFLQSLQEEVIPFLESNYRISSNGRGLAGYSYGGLFVIYALFHTPQLFTRYFAGSPSMWEPLFDHEQAYASQNTDLKAQVFISTGSAETELNVQVQRMVDRLRTRNYPGLELSTYIFEGEGHASCHPAAISRALCMLYYPQLLPTKAAGSVA